MSDQEPGSHIPELEEQGVAEQIASLYRRAVEGDQEHNYWDIGSAVAICYLENITADPISSSDTKWEVKREIDNALAIRKHIIPLAISGVDHPEYGYIGPDPKTQLELTLRIKFFEEACEILSGFRFDSYKNFVIDILCSLDGQPATNLMSEVRKATQVSRLSETSKYNYHDHSQVTKEIYELVVEKVREKVFERKGKVRDSTEPIQQRIEWLKKRQDIGENEREQLIVDEQIDLEYQERNKHAILNEAVDDSVFLINLAISYAIITEPIKTLEKIKIQQLLKTDLAKQALEDLIISFRSVGRVVFGGVYHDENPTFLDDLADILKRYDSLDHHSLEFLRTFFSADKVSQRYLDSIKSK